MLAQGRPRSPAHRGGHQGPPRGHGLHTDGWRGAPCHRRLLHLPSRLRPPGRASSAPGPADTQPGVRPLPFPTAQPGPFFSRPSQIPSCLPFIFCCIGPSLLLESPVPTGQSPRSAEQGWHIPAASPSALSAGYFFLAGWELENDSCIFLLDWSPYFTYLPKSSPSPAGTDVHVTGAMTATVMATTSWLSCLTEETREAGAVACSGRHPVPPGPSSG